MAVAVAYKLLEGLKIIGSCIVLIVAAPFAFTAEALIKISEWIDPDEP